MKINVLFTIFAITCLINMVYSQKNFTKLNGDFLLNETSFKKVAIKTDSAYKKPVNRFVVITEFYTSRDISSNNSIYFTKNNSGLRLVTGILVNEHLIIGVGAGLDDGGIPVSLDLRYLSYEKRSSPILGINIAYNTKNSTGTNESLRFNPTIGIRSFINNKSSVILNIGMCWYTSQYTTYTYRSSNTGLSTTSKLESIPQQYLTFGGGFIF